MAESHAPWIGELSKNASFWGLLSVFAWRKGKAPEVNPRLSH